MNLVVLGATVFVAGLILLGLIFALLRVTNRIKPVPNETTLMDTLEVSSTQDAVLVIQSGGRVVYANQVAREWFGEATGVLEPNIERLARRVRPGEVFWQLCRTEGQARLSLGGQVLEATSYLMPSTTTGASSVLLAMRRPAVDEDKKSDEKLLSNETLLVFSELTKAIAESRSIDTTLEAILTCLESLIPADTAEITVWDASIQALIPYRLVGMSDVDRRLERIPDVTYKPNESFSGYLITHRSPLLIHNVDTYRDIRPPSQSVDYPFRSYLGVPLLIADELVGTLELASLDVDAFTQQELELARILAGQASVGLYNAILIQDEQDRGRELAGLAQIAHAIGASGDQQDLFARMVETIKPLLNVNSLGFLIYDPNRRSLEAQRPFIGIPDQTLSIYRVTIAPNTPAEEIWQSQKTLVTDNAPDDERLSALGLNYLATAAGITQTILAPLNVAGRSLGYLQLGDKPDRSPFTDDDIRLAEILASQTATIIENANLVQQTQERAQRAEALRRIASLTGSVATLDEILQFSLRELSQLLRADIAIIYLMDTERGELTVHADSLFGLNATALTPDTSSLAIDSPIFRSTVTAGQQPYFTANASQEESLGDFYRGIVEELGLNSLVSVPLVIRSRGVGELLLGSRTKEFFFRSDVSLVMTTASQLTIAIERSQLLGQTDESLRRRVEQLTALTHIGREINATLDLDATMKLVYDELLRTTQAHCGNIILFERNDSNGSGFKVTFCIGDERSNRLSPLELLAIEKSAPLVVGDFTQPAGEIEADAEIPHRHVRSAVLVPINYQGNIAGLIHLHGRTVNLFDATAVEIIQALATQAAIALGNAQRYQEQRSRNELLNRRVETLSNLLDVSQNMHIGQPLDEALETIAYAIQESTPFNVVLISIFDQESEQLIRRAGVGLPLDVMDELRSRGQSWHVISQFLSPEFRISQSYFVPRDRHPIQPAELHLETASVSTFERNGDHWHAEDILLIPMYDANQQPLGLISVDAPRNGLRPDRPTIDALELFAHQSTYIIEGWQKMVELNGYTTALQDELDQLRSTANLAEEQLPVLLHKDVEQTLAIQRLSQRAQRIRAGLDIAEIVNQQPDRAAVLNALGQEILTRLDMDVVLVAEPSSSDSQAGPHMLNTFGVLPSNVNPETLLGQRNPLRQGLQRGEIILVSNVEYSDWQGTPLLQALGARAFLSLPIQVNISETETVVDSALLAVSREPLTPASAEDEQIFKLVTRQVGIALQNLHLLTETNRRLREVDLLLEFSRQLGSLDPVQILQTLANSALKVAPMSQAVMVALWQTDEKRLVPHFADGYMDNELIKQITYRSGEALPGKVFEAGEAQLIEEVDFAKQYNLPSDELLLYRDANSGLLPISSLIIPIQTLENKLGVMVLDNFKEPSVYTSDELALVSSLAQQTALALENARLFQSAEQRTAQLEALTNVAATITSNLQTDDLISTLLEQVGSILPYDTGTLWLRYGEQMTVRAAHGFEDDEERVGLSVAIPDSVLLEEMTKTSEPIAVADVREDVRFPSLLEPRYFSWLGVPLLSKGEVVGVIALEKEEANFYIHEYVQAAMTFAGQAAVALENANLFEESSLRALELDQRSQRLALLNRLSAGLSSSLDEKELLLTGLNEMIQAIDCDSGFALMFDNAGKVTIDVEVPDIHQTLPLPLEIIPLFERLRESQGVFVAEDISQEAELEPIADLLGEYKANSLLSIPLVTGSDMHGMFLVHKAEVYRFTPDEVELARTIGNQVAVAIQNARLFSETQRLFAETRQHSAELALLYEMGVNISQVLDQQKLMDATFDNVIRLTMADAVMVAMVDDDHKTFTVNGLDQGERIGPLDMEMSGNSFSELVLKNSAPLLIGDTQEERDSLPVSGESIGEPVRCWLGVPLTVRGAAIGVISVQSYQPNLFDESIQRLLVQVANQLAIAFDNARLLSAAQDYVANLEKSVNERTEQLAREHRRTQTLLGIISELSTSLDLDLVLNRTLRVINDTLGSEHSLIMLINPDEATLQLRASLGYSAPVPKGGIASSLKLDEGLAGWVIGNRQAALIPDLWDDWRWVRKDDQTDLHRSAIAVPLVIGEENLGAMLLFHRQANFFTPDQLELVQATAKQIAVALNNAQLFRLIRDQAERLGDMLRTQHIETSRSQAILEAVADGVLVTDVMSKITLFNDSAENILGLSRQQVVGRSLEHFLGLFGKAGRTWVDTIRTWSEDPTSYIDGEIYAEQIELDDNHVVAVHLSPVRLRNDFLGTVSIFRDITHMVEVDRLKSEFVATVSHELRTPMTSIKGYVEIMLMGAAGPVTEQQAHFLKIVRDNTERLAILVNDLLDISRIESGRATLTMQIVDLPKVVEMSVSDLTRRMEEEQRVIPIELEIAPQLPVVWGDPERVRQIVDNLLENAFQYTPEEDGLIRVKIAADDGFVQIDVIDNGIGITEEEQERIFERFYRGEDPLVLATSGTGLGLSIVQHLIERHNGRIWMESSGVRGEGSTFSFTLPQATENQIKHKDEVEDED